MPAGKYRVGSLLVNNGVTLRGAGPWYTEITAINPSNALFSAESQSGTLHLSDFTAFGQVAVRNDSEPSNFVHGGLGVGGSVSNVWIQNFKVGLWLVHPSNQNIVIENNRMLDFLADGVNFNGYVQNGTIRNNFLRNQGDDSLAIWSIHSPVQATTFANNTIVEPNLATRRLMLDELLGEFGIDRIQSEVLVMTPRRWGKVSCTRHTRSRRCAPRRCGKRWRTSCPLGWRLCAA